MAAVHVVPWSADWPLAFDRLRDALREVFAPREVEIEHIGSTAVPGLAAKPVIDVLVGVGRLDEAEAAIPALAARGFLYVSKYERELPMRRYFVRDAYQSLKLRLAREYASDKAAYTAAKDPFIRAVLDALDTDTGTGPAGGRS
jgi:GrpB-like predicted nucleotidyltransferase (UPF0157 family)